MSSTSTRLSKEHLLGTWRLSACEGRAEDGSVVLPYTDKPEGMLMYHTNGTMMVIYMKPDRPLFESNDPGRGSNEEIRAAFEGFTAHCGRFVLNPDASTVTHHLEQALFPNWVGTQQVRFISLVDGQLSLSTPPILAGGKEWIFSLIWNR
jgi:Lipocalin-like domain